MKKIVIVLLAFVAASCGTASVSPEAAFARLESRLLAGESDIEFETGSTGAVETTVTGSLYVGRSNLRFDALGTVMGESTSAVYTTTDDRRPADVKRAVVIGWTRMGLLHNLVRLLGEQDIDHGGGGVTEWVRVKNISWDEQERMFTFDISVEERDVARARLWLDAKGRPVRREQSVSFPGGSMQVEERYRWR
jgi:hypothetical protein